MKNKAHDVRYINTKNKIISSFKYLINTIGYKKITISKIIKLARINRSTFYNHYLDKEDLMEKVQNDLIYKITRKAPIINTINKRIIKARTKVIVQRIYNNKNNFKLFFSENSDGLFSNRIIKSSKNIIISKNLFNDSNIPPYYAFTLTSNVLVDLIKKWVENNFKESVEEFSNIITIVIYKIYENIIIN